MDEEIQPSQVTSDDEGQQSPTVETSESQLTDAQATVAKEGDNLASETEASNEAAPVSFDADLDSWAEKTHRPVPSTDEERTLLQEIRNSQREYSKNAAAKQSQQEMDKTISETDKGLTGQEYVDPLEAKFAKLEADLSRERQQRYRSEYFISNQVSDEEVKAMNDILKEKVDRAKSVSDVKARAALDYWTDPDNLSDWHALAKARVMEATDTSVIAQDAALKERERIAKEHLAAGPSRGAKSVTMAKPEDPITAVWKDDSI